MLLDGSDAHRVRLVPGARQGRRRQTSPLLRRAVSDRRERRRVLRAAVAEAGAALGGYANTNEGKVIAASFADNYNHIVRAVRDNPSLQREVRPLAEEAAARPKAGTAFNEGDVLRPKISHVKLLGKPSESADTVLVLAKSDEMVFLGKEQDGFVNVETAKGSGWVKKVLVTR